MLRLASSPRVSKRPARGPLASASVSLEAAADRAVAAHDARPYSEKGRALEGFALRMGRPAPEAPAALDPAADWTLAETLDEIERRGARLVLTTRGIKVLHANRMPGLARNARRHERALAVWLSLRAQAPAPAPFDAPEWDAATRLRAAWFALDFEAPPTPFALRPGETCVDASLLRAGIAGRLAAGPLAPSAARLRGELEALFARHAPAVQTEAQPAPYRRAA